MSPTNVGLKYAELILVHRPNNKSNLDVWSGLEVQKMGWAKSIGVSIFNQQHIESIIKHSKVVPANNQIRSNPFYIEQKLVDFCHLHNNCQLKQLR